MLVVLKRTLKSRLPAADRKHLAHFETLLQEFTIQPLSASLPLLLNSSTDVVRLQKRCEPPQTLGRG